MQLPSFQSKRVLITGALGLVGSNLARRLVNLNAKVTIYIRSLENIKNIEEIKDKVEIIVGDIIENEKIEQVIKDKDHIFLLAGQSSVPVSMEQPFLDLEVNCKSTLQVLEACRKNNPNASIVFAGTIREAGPIPGTYAIENQREDPTSLFDLHKLVSEKYLQIYNKVYGLKTVTLRFSNIYGDGVYNTHPHSSVINHFVKKALQDRKLQVYGDGGPLRDYNYVGNIVDACLLSATTNKCFGNFYITGSGQGRNFKQFLEELQRILKQEKNIELEIEKIETPEVIARTVQGDVIADFNKLKKDTCWYPKIDFEHGLKSVVEFYSKIKD